MLERLGYQPDPDKPGGLFRPQTQDDRFPDIYGELRAWPESETLSRIRFVPQPRHSNIIESVHGGFLLALIDHVLFVGPAVQGRERLEGGATIDVSAQFLSFVLVNKPVDILIETLRETHRMVFVRGIIEQDGIKAVAFSGTVKKASTGS